MIQESMGITLARGVGLPGQSLEGRPSHLDRRSGVLLRPGPRIADRAAASMVSGWAAPVQVGNHVLAVLEFYCHFLLREDRETTAAMETVAASLAQMLARTRERGRADELSRQQEILLGFGGRRHLRRRSQWAGALCQSRCGTPAGSARHRT